MFIALYGIERSRLHTRPLKIWSLICAALGTALLLLVCFGADICHFPLDGEISRVWSSRISEMRPVWRQDWDTVLAVYPFGAASLILSFLLLRCKSYRRMMLLNLCLGLPLFALSLAALRFANYQSLYNILPWLCLIDLTYKKALTPGGRALSFPHLSGRSGWEF